MAQPNILAHPIFTELVLPFLLVFVLIFAILDKTKIFGEGKKQINALIAFVVGLIFVTFSQAVGITNNLVMVMAVVAVVILVFVILFSFASGGEFKGEKWMKITFGILVGIVIIIALLVFTGYWSKIIDTFSGESGTGIASNVIFIVIIIAAFAIVLATSKAKSA